MFAFIVAESIMKYNCKSGHPGSSLGTLWQLLCDAAPPLYSKGNPGLCLPVDHLSISILASSNESLHGG